MSQTQTNQKSSVVQKLKNMGPAAIICASIVGPGTVTTASLAGINYKYALLWAVLFSAISTGILQLMTSRLGIITKRGLAENIRLMYEGSWLKVLFTVIIIFAIGVGNSAYQGGNISGSIMGLSTVFGGTKLLWSVTITVIVFGMLWTGSYDYIEKLMTALVGIMIFLFVVTAVVVKPNIGELLNGLLIPKIPKGGLLIAMGVIGTTVVPHVVFLHSAITAKKWNVDNVEEALDQNRFDTLFNITITGLITMAIVITGAALFGSGIETKSSLDLAKQLEPLVGTWAKYFFGFGIFAAGISSAAVAPMSAALAIAGILGWSTDLKDKKFRILWIFVLLCGFVVASTGINPIQIILVAQTFNGILLPLTAIILLLAMNKKEFLGKYVNTRTQNIVGILIICVTIVLGCRSLYTVILNFL